MRRLAAEELRRDAAWYNLRRRGLGRELRNAIQTVLDGIVAHPKCWPVYLDDVRRALASGFPYPIYYRVKEDRIVVLRVVHTARDPGPIRDLLP